LKSGFPKTSLEKQKVNDETNGVSDYTISFLEWKRTALRVGTAPERACMETLLRGRRSNLD